MASRIEDYALIGDCQSAALVCKGGSIDWLCFPRFDSPACFAAMLGTGDHGRWLLAPAAPTTNVTRRYRPGTMVLETTFETADGAILVTDFMPPRAASADLGVAPAAVVRIVRGVRGKVDVRTELVVRFEYGSVVPWVRRADERGCGIVATAGPDTLVLRSDVPLHGEDFHTVAEFAVGEGEEVAFCLSWHPTYEEPGAAVEPAAALASTVAFWEEWSGRSTYRGPWADAVNRSLLTLKAMTYAPTGGIVAAATTSLPEQLGGSRNWDYRLCWLRDATFALYALMVGGYTEEASAWRTWLINAVAGTPEDLQIMYGLAGERRLTELELPWLPGYENSKPVRTGNAAYDQRQLDVYGEVMAALYAARKAGLPADGDAWRVQRAVARFVEDAWREPDNGIWEVRGPRRHFTHSKVMAWVALDRAVKEVETHGFSGDVDRWRTVRDAIRDEVMAKGFNPAVNAFTQYYGSDQPDASLLMLPLVGFVDAADPKMVGTVDLIRRKLTHKGLIYRYACDTGVDGLEGDEGVFLLCTFWLADVLAMRGDVAEATEIFERLLSLQNDVGLLSEQYDPVKQRQLGNVPQAFSHVGLINTAKRLAAAIEVGRSDGRRKDKVNAAAKPTESLVHSRRS